MNENLAKRERIDAPKDDNNNDIIINSKIDNVKLTQNSRVNLEKIETSIYEKF